MQMMCNIMIDCDAKYSMEHLIEVMVGANLRIKNNYGYMIAYREDDRRYYKTEGDLVKDFQERIIEAAIFWDENNEGIFVWWDLAVKPVKMTVSFDGWTIAQSMKKINDICLSLINNNYHRGSGVFFSLEAG